MNGKVAAMSALVLVGVVGCSIESEPVKAQPVNAAPVLDLAPLPQWPPVGPSTGVTVTCDDDVNVSRVEARFRSTTVRTTAGRHAQVLVSGAELGEGIGTFKAECCDDRGLCGNTRQINRLLVDLSAPEIAKDRLMASPTGEGLDGEISVWVADAWILGAVELTFQGKTLRKELPHVYPSTLGKEWDVSRIAFAAKDLPAGTGLATVVAYDAAGNRATMDMTIRVDATAPTVAIRAPTPDAVIAGDRIPVQVFAADADNPVPPTIEIAVGGVRVAELQGPTASLEIDTASLAKGPVEIRAIARDNVGNLSKPTVVTVNVE
ncbi:MAG: hypothetical protein HOO96_16905 [Polyangiaceae bacterium]|nr:hypothetical protein [Polyangiaceae bacterium]